MELLFLIKYLFICTTSDSDLRLARMIQHNIVEGGKDLYFFVSHMDMAMDSEPGEAFNQYILLNLNSLIAQGDKAGMEAALCKGWQLQPLDFGNIH
ncbi:hypothetical protein C5167_042852 [Papaver somniferum]|uniref:Uncharacterized protein n=1 Tax=Papaver somniferum TaxID=3469 RepID=A0A4Y7L403_PAPSO|nr:hypothetical protein C5167_042852 [Papaver somniferum]